MRCECRRPLTFKTGSVHDGSQCEQRGQLLHIFQEETVIQATVRKPKDLNKTITVRAQSQEVFDATIETDDVFLRFVFMAYVAMPLSKPTMHSSGLYLWPM